jgi:predicted  nucleic acid-binding Zn-ribbon protein
MPRGRRRATVDVGSLEDELQKLKQRQAELRQQIKRVRNSQSEIGKLEEKLAAQLATAKWTVRQIRELRPEWEEIAFYTSVQAKQPAPRGRRPRKAADAAAE